MSLNKRIVKILKEKRITKAQLSKAVGIPYTTLDSMLKRDSDTAKIETIYKIAEYLDLTVEELVFDDPKIKKPVLTNITESEIQLIKRYRSIDNRGRGAIDTLLEYEIANDKNMSLSSSEKRSQSGEMRRMQVFNSPAAAGEALPIIAEDYNLIRTSEAPEEATFGIKISGDSMEPKIMDSSIVWVKKQESVSSGEIGIFILNGESLCKKLEHKDGKCLLVSINDKYSPINVLESDDLRVVGKVLI